MKRKKENGNEIKRGRSEEQEQKKPGQSRSMRPSNGFPRSKSSADSTTAYHEKKRGRGIPGIPGIASAIRGPAIPDSEESLESEPRPTSGQRLGYGVYEVMHIRGIPRIPKMPRISSGPIWDSQTAGQNKRGSERSGKSTTRHPQTPKNP